MRPFYFLFWRRLRFKELLRRSSEKKQCYKPTNSPPPCLSNPRWIRIYNPNIKDLKTCNKHQRLGKKLTTWLKIDSYKAYLRVP